MNPVFITGGTGYMGRRLINLLIHKGFNVTALVREGSQSKLPSGCGYTIADPFNAITFSKDIPRNATFVQLLGVHHPGPRKKKEFRTIDLASARASAEAAKQAGVRHFVYVSVAQTPTRIMRDFQLCRAEGEAAIVATEIPATFIRPWYVVGPGHYWPLLFLPVFKMLEWLRSTSQKARALRLITLKQMLNTLLYVIEKEPQTSVRIIEIDRIQKI